VALGITLITRGNLRRRRHRQNRNSFVFILILRRINSFLFEGSEKKLGTYWNVSPLSRRFKWLSLFQLAADGYFCKLCTLKYISAKS